MYEATYSIVRMKWALEEVIIFFDDASRNINKINK
jgi:hypothetical protein